MADLEAHRWSLVDQCWSGEACASLFQR